MFSNLNKPTFGSPASATTSFGLGASTSNSSSPWGNTGNNQIFGKTATSGFGQQPSTSFGQASTSTTPLFPFFSQSNSSGFGSTPTNQTTFGSNMGSNMFGQQPAATNAIFGTTNTFGQQKPTGFGFGTQAQQRPANMFGQAAQPQSSLFQPSGSNTLFGSNVGFGANNVGAGTTIKFNPVTGTDTMQKSGSTTTINTKHHCITCMKEYEGKSFEELRLEDYQANRKGPQSQFGSTPFGGTPSMFGQATENKPAFGQATTFGQIGGTSTFGPTPNFGLNAQQSTPSNIFGKPPVFGTSTTATPAFGGFNATSNVTNAFGTSPAKPFGTATSTPLFGATPAQQQTNAFGNNLFGQTNQNASGSFFNKPAQTTGFGATGFSFNQTPATTTNSLFQPSKPGFGLVSQPTTSVFGQTNAFGQPNQQTTFGASPFGKTAFGQTQTTFQPTGQSSLFPSTQQKPGSLLGTGGMGGGLFGTMNFGSNNATSFGLTQSTVQVQNQGFSLDASTQESKNLPLLTSNQFGHSPFLTGLLPVEKTSSPTFYTTNPSEIKKMLENNKKVDENSNNTKLRLKLGPPKTQRDNLFEEGNDEDINRFFKTSCKRLVLKKKQEGTKNSIFETDSIYVDLTPQNDSTLLSPIGSDTNLTNTIYMTSPEVNSDSPLMRKDRADHIKNVALNLMKKLPDVPIKAKKSDSSISLSDKLINLDSLMNFDTPKTMSSEEYSKNKHPELSILSKSESENSSVKVLDPQAVQKASEEALSDNDSKLESTRKVGKCGIVLNRAEYYTLPSIEELDQMVTEDGRCMVKGFTIGRKGYGNLHFPEELDVKNLDLDEIVHFRYKEIHMYPDESKKPPVGEGLNRRAQVTLDRVYPRVKETKEIIDDVNQVLAAKFPDQLVEISAKHGLKFVDYRPETGSWVFMVEHFSKYAFTESDEEDCELTIMKRTSEKNIIEGELDSRKQRIIPERERTYGLKGTRAHLILDDMEPDIASEYTDEGDNRQGDVLHKSMTIDFEEHDYMNPIYEPTDQDIFYHNSQIQLMKATFFSESESVSTVSSMEYLGPQKNQLFNIEQEPKEQKPPQRPKVWKIYVNIASRPNDSLLLKASRCYSDLGVFKGKSFKVGWSKGFEKYSVKFPIKTDFENSISICLSTIPQERRSDVFDECITDSIKLAQECSEFILEGEEGIPTFSIMSDRTYLMECHKVFKKVSDKSRGTAEFIYNDVWSLCFALWGPGRRSTPFVKHRLSAWLKKSLEYQPSLYKPHRTASVRETLDTILNMLTRYQVKEAAELAMEANMPSLSLIISQINLSQKLKSQVHHQIESWYNNMYADHISNEMMLIYLLISGNLYNSNINVCGNLDWKRAFGVHLWYMISEGSPVQAAIEAYTKSFTSNYAATPYPVYACESSPNSMDVLYHILQLYTNPTYRLTKILNPETYTSNLTDYRLSWVLLLFFKSIRVGLIDECEETYIHISFSSQLENIGLWDYAILPLLYLKDNYLKKSLVLGILSRNLCTIDDEKKSLEIETKLLQDFRVPYSWINSIKAQKKTRTVQN